MHPLVPLQILDTSKDFVAMTAHVNAVIKSWMYCLVVILQLIFGQHCLETVSTAGPQLETHTEGLVTLPPLYSVGLSSLWSRQLKVIQNSSRKKSKY